MNHLLENILLGPLDDLRRFISSALTPTPPTRVYSEVALTTARQTLADAGCDLSACTVTNLHTFPVNIPPAPLFDLLMSWQQWPRSGFFACSDTDRHNIMWFSYRWWKLFPVVLMKLRLTQPSCLIIYDIVDGIGPGGYHAFLINQLELPTTFAKATHQTSMSIFTTFPEMNFLPFPERLHDQVNFDIYRKLQILSQKGQAPHE